MFGFLGVYANMLGTESQIAMKLFRNLGLSPELKQRFMKDLKLGTKKEIKDFTVAKLREKVLREVELPALASNRGAPPAGAMMALEDYTNDDGHGYAADEGAYDPSYYAGHDQYSGEQEDDGEIEET